MIKAKRLLPGASIGVVSPSWGGAARFPHRVARGVKQLEALGYRVKLGRHALNTQGFVSDSAENRASDIHEFFTDPSVRMILAAIGGDHSCHLLPLLDFELIRNNPKIVIGYSDVTVLNVALWQAAGLVTFNGPALLTDFAEYPAMLEYSRLALSKVLCSATAAGRVTSAPEWTEEVLEWSTGADLERPRRMERSPGWTWLRPGIAEGPLVGGCIESLQHLRGTRFWPDLRGAILFVETSEEKPSPATVDGILMDYENMGVFEHLQGLLIGRPMRYSMEEKSQLREVILERTRRYAFPIVTDMDFGHTSPQMTLPLGCRGRIDSSARSFEILEAAVTE